MAKPVDNTVRNSVPVSSTEPPAPRVSGFVSQGLGASLEADSAAQSLAAQANFPAPDAPDVAVRQVAALTAQLQVRDVELAELREQLRDSVREAAWLREANRLRARETEGVPSAAVSADGDHVELQATLETAWQDLQDARTRIAALEDERDAALRQVDELRVELYGMLEAAKDEAIAAENRLTEQQHAFDDAREAWVTDHAQLRAELEEAQLALLAQIQENTELRQSLLPPAPSSPTSAFAVPLVATTELSAPSLLPSVESSAAPIDELPLPPAEPTNPVPLVNPSTFPGAPALPRPHYTAHRPDTEDGSARQHTLSSLVGFDTTPPAITEDTPEEPFQVGKAFRKPTKSFGLGRLFRSS